MYKKVLLPDTSPISECWAWAGLGGQGWYWQISAADTGHAAALQYTGQPLQTTKTVICTAPSSSQWSLVPGAWVHIMQHASNHHPATIDANIQLSAWLRSYREFIHLLNVEHHHPRPLLLVLCRWYSSSILINTKTKYFSLGSHLIAGLVHQNRRKAWLYYWREWCEP